MSIHKAALGTDPSGAWTGVDGLTLWSKRKQTPGPQGKTRGQHSPRLSQALPSSNPCPLWCWSANGMVARETYAMNEEGTSGGFWWRKIAGPSWVWELLSTEEGNWHSGIMPPSLEKPVSPQFCVSSAMAQSPPSDHPSHVILVKTCCLFLHPFPSSHLFAQSITNLTSDTFCTKSPLPPVPSQSCQTHVLSVSVIVLEGGLTFHFICPPRG